MKRTASAEEKKFVRAALIAWMPLLDWDYEKAVRYADRAWQRLQAGGYGNKDHKPLAPNPLDNHYKGLTSPQREAFDAFWIAYGHKVGRSRAAMRWAQMGDLTKAQYQVIIDAARADAQRERPEGTTRKMAEGWLSERRWEDATTQTGATRINRAKLRELMSEYRALTAMRDAAEDQAQKDALNISLRKLQERISEEEALTGADRVA